MSLSDQFNGYIHSAYSDECKSDLLEVLNNEISPVLEDAYRKSSISPSNGGLILRSLEQDPCNKIGIILGMDPYPYNATGIPFEDPVFKQMSNKNIASNIARIYGLEKESISGCNLYNLKDSIFLLNAAFTVPTPIKGSRSSSGAHFDLWKKFVQILLTYILKSSPNCRFILVFGKSQHLSDLSDTAISAANSSAYKLISYHPCMAVYFLAEKSNPFQEVNALLRLLEEDEVKWYKALPDFAACELKEVREIDEKNTFIHLSKTLIVKLCDLNSYEALLGDLEAGIVNSVLDNTSTVIELSKIYNRSLADFNLTISNLLTSVAKPIIVPNDSNPETHMCGFTYSVGRVIIYIRSITGYRSYTIDPMNYFFHERFGSRKVVGTFSLSVSKDDTIPLNAYECLVDIIYSNKVDYCMVEMITQLMKKLKPLADEPNHVVVEDVVYDRPTTYITDSGLVYQTDITPKGLLHPGRDVILDNGLTICLRQLYDHNSKNPEPMNRHPVNPIFSLLLYIEKDYHKALSLVSKFSKSDEVIQYYDIERLRQLSVFHLGVSSIASIPPRSFQNKVEDLDIQDGTVYSADITSKIEALKQEEERLTDLFYYAKQKAAIVKKIENARSSMNELYISSDIIRQINRILKYLGHDASI